MLLLGRPRTRPSSSHILWSLQGKTNTVYLLGSVHFLKRERDSCPQPIDAAYADAEALVMEIDMDDLDPAGDAAGHPGARRCCRRARRWSSSSAPQTYEQVRDARRARLGVEPAMLDRFQPWFAAITLVQLQLMKMGLDPELGRRAAADAPRGRRRQADPGPGNRCASSWSMLARLPEKQQREFLLYSVEDAERMASEVDELLAAWRSGDATAMAKLLQEGFDEYPDLYRPLTVERNRKWIPQIEQLLDDRDDYLVVVGALHLVGKDSVIDLLERKGYKVKQL